MPIIESNSAFNIDGDNPEKGKSSIDFSALHIFDVLETSYIENEKLLSSFQHENQFIIEEGVNSFLITDNLFKKTTNKPEAPNTENKKREHEVQIPVFPRNISEISEKEAIEETFFAPVVVEKTEKSEQENIIVEKEVIEEAFFAPVVAEKTEKAEQENIIVEKEVIEEAVVAEKTENVLVINEPLIIPESQGIENGNTSSLLNKNSKEIEKDINIGKKEIILHKKRNLLVKIIVNEGELAQYFESKDNTLFTEADNMSPETTSIINRFLEKEPKLSRKRMNVGEKDTPIQNLLQRDEDDIVTETMAYIYAIQGNKTEALRIYEKLSLQFPEKSAYFATRIKAVMKD